MARVERPRLAIDVRGGYSYEPTPVPEQIGERNSPTPTSTPSRSAPASSSSASRVLPRPLAIDVHFATTYLPARANRKLDPLDAVGDFVSDGFVPQLGIELKTRFR